MLKKPTTYKRVLPGLLFSVFLTPNGFAEEIKLNFWGLKAPTLLESSAKDQDYELYSKALESGNPILSDLSIAGWENLWNNSRDNELKYGYIFGESSSTLVSTADKLTVNRKLDLKVLQVPGNATEQTTTLALATVQTGQEDPALTFKEFVNLEIQRLSNCNSAAIYVDNYSSMNFEKGLSIKDASSFSSTLTAISDTGQLNIQGDTKIETKGTAFQFLPPLSSAKASLSFDGKIQINAGQIFDGSGIVKADGAFVTLDGSLDKFSGTYTQTGGSLVLASTVLLDDKWKFGAVSITTCSENLFTVSAEDYVSGTLLQGRVPSLNANPFSEIVLTDEKVRLEYLNRACDFYSTATITYTGELLIDDRVINTITLDRNFGLLDKMDKIGLASVRLDLESVGELTNQTIKIGSITSDLKHLVLSGSDVVLYSPGPASTTEKLELIQVGNNSSLTVHGLTNTAKDQKAPARLTSSVHVTDGGKLNFSGPVVISEEAVLINEGELSFKEFSKTEAYEDIYQTAGSTTIKKGAIFTGDKGVYALGGLMNIEGDFKSEELHAEGSSLYLTGKVQANDLTLGASNKAGAMTSFSLREEGEGTFKSADLHNSVISIEGNAKDKVVASLHLKDWKGSGNHISVGQNGLLILGDDLSGDGLGYGRNEALEILNHFGDFYFGVLVVNQTQKVGLDNLITLGSVGRAEASGVNFGAGSALLFRARSGEAAFSSSDGTGLKFSDGSSILVADPFGTNQLTDSTFETIQGKEDVSLVSLNKNLTLKLENIQGQGWFITRDEVLTQNFLYPELQGWLYDNPENLTVDSSNVAQQFFARVDNDVYFNRDNANRLIAETTQAASLIGTRMNFYLQSREGVSEERKQLGKALSSTQDLSIFGGIYGRFFFSDTLGGFLESSKYRASSETVRIGLSKRTDSGTAWTVMFEGGHSSSESRHSILSLKGKQNAFNLSASFGRSFGNTTLSLNASAGQAKTDINGSMPTSMQMGRLKGEVKDFLIGLGGEISYGLTEGCSVALSPQIWTFTKSTEKTHLSGQKAFELKAKKQTFVDIPLSVRGNWDVGSFMGVNVNVSSALGGSIKAGNLDKKGRLRAIGTPAGESIAQRELRRWNAFGSAGIELKKGNFSGVVGAAASTGDGKVEAMLNLKANWRF